eukprot:scaffold19245_cov118-Isochrysis_galbana.AAC.8
MPDGRPVTKLLLRSDVRRRGGSLHDKKRQKRIKHPTVNRPVAMASSALLTVRGVEYGVGLTADGEALRVDLQDTQTGELWSGTFNTRCEGGSAR